MQPPLEQPSFFLGRIFKRCKLAAIIFFVVSILTVSLLIITYTSSKSESKEKFGQEAPVPSPKLPTSAYLNKTIRDKEGKKYRILAIYEREFESYTFADQPRPFLLQLGALRILGGLRQIQAA